MPGKELNHRNGQTKNQANGTNEKDNTHTVKVHSLTPYARREQSLRQSPLPNCPGCTTHHKQGSGHVIQRAEIKSGEPTMNKATAKNDDAFLLLPRSVASQRRRRGASGFYPSTMPRAFLSLPWRSNPPSPKRNSGGGRLARKEELVLVRPSPSSSSSASSPSCRGGRSRCENTETA